MRKIMFLSLCATLAMGCADNQVSDYNNPDGGPQTALSQSTDVAVVDEATSAFLKEAASANMKEVALSELADNRSQTEAVKEYASMIINDHLEAGRHLHALGNQKDVELPDDDQEMLPAHLNDVSRAEQFNGAAYEQHYMTMMVQDHKASVSKYEAMQNQVTDPDVKEYITKTLPVLRKHLARAEELSQSMSFEQ